MSEADATIAVQVVYALPRRAWSVELRVAPGIMLGEAIHRSGLHAVFPEAIVDDAHVGVYAQPASLGQIVRDGDRIEIYRPLQVDPMQARRARAEVQRARGRR